MNRFRDETGLDPPHSLDYGIRSFCNSSCR